MSDGRFGASVAAEREVEAQRQVGVEPEGHGTRDVARAAHRRIVEPLKSDRRRTPRLPLEADLVHRGRDAALEALNELRARYRAAARRDPLRERPGVALPRRIRAQLRAARAERV